MTSPFDQAAQLTNLWMDFTSRMMASTKAFVPEHAPPQIAKEIRATMFSAMSEQAEKFMRGPQFLEVMRHSMQQSIAMRKQLNDLLTKAHHNVQAVARQDVDTLLLSVRHLEGRLLEQMEGVVDRLEAISGRLDALEKAAGQGSDGKNNGHATQRRDQPTTTSSTGTAE
jgi:hypothetical protein